MLVKFRLNFILIRSFIIMTAADHNHDSKHPHAHMHTHFGEDETKSLLGEDNEALKNVSVLLAAIIALGVGIALVAIWLTVPN
jgi:hypothetical protein